MRKDKANDCMNDLDTDPDLLWRRIDQGFIAVRDEAVLPDKQLQQPLQQQPLQGTPVDPNLQLSAGVNEAGRHSGELTEISYCL